MPLPVIPVYMAAAVGRAMASPGGRAAVGAAGRYIKRKVKKKIVGAGKKAVGGGKKVVGGGKKVAKVVGEVTKKIPSETMKLGTYGVATSVAKGEIQKAYEGAKSIPAAVKSISQVRKNKKPLTKAEVAAHAKKMKARWAAKKKKKK